MRSNRNVTEILKGTSSVKLLYLSHRLKKRRRNTNLSPARILHELLKIIFRNNLNILVVSLFRIIS